MADVKYISKADSWLMKLAGFFTKIFGVPFSRMWTTMGSRIYYPATMAKYPAEGTDGAKAAWIAQHQAIIQHELVHVAQFKRWTIFGVGFLYLIFPLPVLFSGRWWIERPAYLLDIRSGYRTPQSAAHTLTKSYFYPWPNKWMIDWFLKELTKDPGKYKAKS